MKTTKTTQTRERSNKSLWNEVLVAADRMRRKHNYKMF